MAHYYEYYTSGEGDATGLSGVDASRTFIVILDEVDDDPITVIQDGTGIQAGIPIGAPHPDWNRFPYAVAFDYIKEEKKGPKAWLIRIPYMLPSAATPTQDEWLMRWRVATETELMKTDLTGKPIGPHAYEVAAQGTSPTHTAFGGKEKLVQVEGGRRRTGLQRSRPVHSFTLTRTLSQITATQLAIVATYDNKINAYPLWPIRYGTYHMFGPRLVKFVGIDFREEIGVSEGQTQSGLIYPTELSFLVNLDGWSPVKEFDVWPNDRGDESLVYPLESSEPVSETYKIYEEEDLSKIIFALGGGTIRLLGART